MNKVFHFFKEKPQLTILFLLFIVGLCSMYDYGISWDEAVQREHGLKSYNFIISKVQHFLGLNNPELISVKVSELSSYGTLFQTIAVALEKLFNAESTSEYFYLRHWMVFILFMVSTYSFFSLLNQRFQDKWLAALGMCMLICSPRIYGHSFFNVKDLIFLSVYLFALHSLVKWIYTHNAIWLCLHALFTAICIATRSLGIYMLFISVFIILLSLKNQSVKLTKGLKITSVYIFISLSLTLFFWPYLWKLPIASFTNSIQEMSQFQWGGEVLLDANSYKATEIPWFYTLRWINISTPIVFQLLILLGIFIFIVQRLKSISLLKKDLISDYFIFFAFAGPLIAVILFKSTLYDGWRHLYFVWPPLLYFALFGLFYLLKIKPIVKSPKHLPLIRNIIFVLLIFPMIYIMGRIHPFQNVYFNGLAKQTWVENYELDYWGQGYKETMIRFAKSIPDDIPVCIYGGNYPAWECYQTLPEEIKSKLHYVWKEEFAEYYISNFRFKWVRDNYLKKEHLMKNEIYSVNICGQTIFAVFQLFE